MRHGTARQRRGAQAQPRNDPRHRYMGDGVLIYFGYPRAHEDDAERAVGAALAVIEAVGRLPAREDLRVRLGIATGLAVVGDLIGEGAAQERGVIG
jgi:class 3 adenylate cyclase